ncbi:MAG: 6-bladed beta-propeller [Tenuifilaceae bacterium]|nr:6-bladed beta-propeller [Tenuifilaceae bacterium]
MIKTMLLYSSVFITLIVLCGCNNEYNSTAKLMNFKDSTLVLSQKIEIIRLETKPDCQLGYIDKTYIDTANDRIFVLSDFNFFLFNLKGEYITKLSIGKGPQEVIRIVSFVADTEKEIFYALDMANSLAVFNYDGIFLKRISLFGFYGIDIFLLNNEEMLILNNWVGRNEHYFVGNFDYNQEKITGKQVHSKESPYPLNTLLTFKNFYKRDDKVYFYSANIFGLFEYENTNFKRLISFDLDHKGVPRKFYKQFENQNRSAFREESKSRNYAPFLLYAFPFNDYFLVGIDDNNYSCYAINRNNNAKIYHTGSIPSYFNLPDAKSLRVPKSIQNDLISFSCNPIDFFEPDEEQQSKTIRLGIQNIEVRYSDNPIIIIIY